MLIARNAVIDDIMNKQHLMEPPPMTIENLPRRFGDRLKDWYQLQIFPIAKNFRSGLSV